MEQQSRLKAEYEQMARVNPKYILDAPRELYSLNTWKMVVRRYPEQMEFMPDGYFLSKE